MTGIGMLLKQVGLDPEKVQTVFNQFTEQFPQYLNAVGQKVSSIDQRLAILERENATLRYQNHVMMDLLTELAKQLGVEVPKDGNTRELIPSHSGAGYSNGSSVTPSRSNGDSGGN